MKPLSVHSLLSHRSCNTDGPRHTPCGQVACTCLSTNTAMLARRVFDVCIVDEASQITLPATIGALLKVRRTLTPFNASTEPRAEIVVTMRDHDAASTLELLRRQTSLVGFRPFLFATLDMINKPSSCM